MRDLALYLGLGLYTLRLLFISLGAGSGRVTEARWKGEGVRRMLTPRFEWAFDSHKGLSMRLNGRRFS